ncbi:unnamed protein product, partial [Allacma fusca]
SIFKLPRGAGKLQKNIMIWVTHCTSHSWTKP